jgi:uncharacterized membrane protein
MFDATDPPEIVLFLGRFHPLLVHLPIGFLLIAFLLELFSRLKRYQTFAPAVSFVLFLGAWSSVLAAGLGYLLSLGGGYDADLLARHQYLGLAVAAAAILSLYFKSRLSKHNSILKTRLYTFTLSSSVVLLLAAGHYGGALTHGEDYLTAYFPTSTASFTAGANSKKKKAKLIRNLPEAVVYTDIIQPIFDSRCTSCHNTKKKKGDLQLDSFAGLQAGGKGGEVIQPGSTQESELYKRLKLPPENKKAMPPKGKEPLTESELQLISWWINQGEAAAGKKVKELALTPTIQAAFANRTAETNKRVNPVFAKKVKPATEEDLQAANKAGFLILPFAKGSSFLRVQKKAGGDPPKDFSVLQPLTEQIIILDLKGTTNSESSLAVVNSCKNLIRLHLENTNISDEYLAQLQNLNYLEYLNLYGNPITDKGILSMKKKPHLRKIYLWQTNVTAAGIAALQRKMPELQILGGVSLVGKPITKELPVTKVAVPE